MLFTAAILFERASSLVCYDKLTSCVHLHSLQSFCSRKSIPIVPYIEFRAHELFWSNQILRSTVKNSFPVSVCSNLFSFDMCVLIVFSTIDYIRHHLFLHYIDNPLAPHIDFHAIYDVNEELSHTAPTGPGYRRRVRERRIQG